MGLTILLSFVHTVELPSSSYLQKTVSTSRTEPALIAQELG
jgi:hypothetical protein